MKNDLVSRQDAKDAVDMALDTIDHVPEWVYDILLNSLDKVPSAEPDKDLIHLQKEQAYMQGYEDGRKSRKKGKWIEKDDCWDGIHYECSVCKYSFSSTEGTPSDNDYYFCPNCGSYNGGEEE